MRLLESAVLVTQTIKTDNGIPIALKTEGTIHHNLAVGQSGHSFGPPGPYLILRAAIATHAVLTNVRSPPTEEGRQMALQHIKAIVEGYRTPIPALPNDPRIAHIAAKDNINTKDVTTKINKQIEAEVRVEITSEFQALRCRECRGNP